jgi:putative ABC transport system permease protein
MIGFQLKRTLLLGLKSLWLHGLRSMLTVLGMVFGVCSVIAMLAIGEGASYEAQEQIKQLGSTNIIIRAVKPPDDRTDTRTQTRRVAQYGLTYDDVERIAVTIPTVQVTVPTRRIRKDLWHFDRRADGALLGTVPWYPSIMNREVADGRFLSSMDLNYRANVCVLEPGVADALFPFGDAVGSSVKVGMDYYRVIGVMAPASRAKAAGKDDIGGVYIPLTTARSRFGDVLVTISSGSQQMENVEIHEVIISVPSVDQVVETAAVIRQALQRFHTKQDYEMVVPLELLQRAKQIKRTYDIVLGSIAAISLLVGGIGIMNIMLASITERTREIGIRRALGAKRKHIIMQFLTETVLLSVSGGVLGIIVGVIIPALVEHFAEMKTIVTLSSLIVAFTISALIGVIFGLYPAYRAANMDPIEALRHE